LAIALYPPFSVATAFSRTWTQISFWPLSTSCVASLLTALLGKVLSTVTETALNEVVPNHGNAPELAT
jgi:hypothetical protein